MRFKDSGIEWLGEIPKHWEVRKLKYLAQFYTGNSIKDSEKSQYEVWEENSIPYIATKDIEIDSCVVDYENGMYIKKNNLNFLKAPKSSVLLCVEGGSAGKKLAFLNQEVCFVNKLCCINADKISINKKMLFYILQSNFFGNLFFSSIKGLIGGITSKELAEFKIPLPPLEEQKAIAEFLDKKCDKISQFIESKQKLIALLTEKKQALINAVVCRGLNKNAELKESGVKYLGIIPKHWEVRKLKSLFSLGNGLNITKENFASCGIPCVNYGEIHSKYPCRLDIAIHKLPFVSKEYLRIKPQSLLQKGDFVFADTSEDIEGSGNFTSIQSSESIFAGYHTIILKPKSEINSLYFSFLFDSLNVRHQIRKEVCGVKVYSITKAILKEVQLIIPPLQEQKVIASYLDTQITKIDLAIEKTKQQITYIKEYKTSLINQAICGRMQLNKRSE